MLGSLRADRSGLGVKELGVAAQSSCRRGGASETEYRISSTECHTSADARYGYVSSSIFVFVVFVVSTMLSVDTASAEMTVVNYERAARYQMTEDRRQKIEDRKRKRGLSLESSRKRRRDKTHLDPTLPAIPTLLDRARRVPQRDAHARALALPPPALPEERAARVERREDRVHIHCMHRPSSAFCVEDWERRGAREERKRGTGTYVC